MARFRSRRHCAALFNAAALIAGAGCTGAIDDGESRNADTTNGGPRDPSNPTNPSDPIGVWASSRLRRLTRSQFQNSLRDLLGTVRASELEPDSLQLGFATVGAGASSASPTAVEKYETAALAAVSELFSDEKARDALIGCKATDAGCARQFVTRFGRRAWRRPLTDEEIQRYTLVATANATRLGDVHQGLMQAVSGLLQSPYFLYRVELGKRDPLDARRLRYDSFEMASRLSYFLLDSTPDQGLLDAAEKEGLLTAEGVRAEADWLLRSSRGRESVVNFSRELFQVDQIATVPKDPARFPLLTPGARAAMAAEIPALFGGIFDRNEDALGLFDGTLAMVNADLAKLYRIPNVTSATPVPARLPDFVPRAGLLGTAGWLARYATVNDTATTRRGRFIREMLMCIPTADPPGDVLTIPPPTTAKITKRQYLEQMHLKTGAACAGCHSLLDPPGLALETFDAIGAYRVLDRGLPIDPSGELDGVHFDNARQLGQVLRANAKVRTCLVRNLYRYATGHPVVGSEEQVIADLDGGFVKSGHRFRSLLVDLVSSDGFRFASSSP